MELFATSVSVGFALLSLVAAFRWIGRATAGSTDAGVRRAKLGFFLAFVALLLLFGAMFGILEAARPYGQRFAGYLAAGVFFAGLVTICQWGALAQIRAMGLQGEGPVILSPGSRRKIMFPLICGNVMGVLAAAVLIWFGARAPAGGDNDWVLYLAMGLTFGGVGWPLYAVRRRVEIDRAAAASRPAAPADAPPDRR